MTKHSEDTSRDSRILSEKTLQNQLKTARGVTPDSRQMSLSFSPEKIPETHQELGHPDQLVLRFPHRKALKAEDFLVSDSNIAAVKFIDSWPNWPDRMVLLWGPPGAGKSHLARVWQCRSQAITIAAENLVSADFAHIPVPAGLVLEDIEWGLRDEHVLFHLLNLAVERGFFVLATARSRPGSWTVDLPDLRSRLRALPLVTLDAPNDDLLKMLLIKQFADRQLAVAPEHIEYLFARVDRSVDYLSALVAEIDRVSLIQKRTINRAFLREILTAFS